jgi:hypothetical protein
VAATAISQTLASAVAARKKGVFTATVVWTLQASISDGLIDMVPDRVAFLFLASLPLEGSPYPGVPLATCRGVSCTTTDESGIYTFTAEYSDENSAEQGATNENPLLDRPIIKPVANIESKLMTRDRDGLAILNTARDPLLQSVDDNTIGFQITANVGTIPNWLGGLRNTCNSGAITIAGLPIAAEAARFILPSNWLSSQKSRNDVNYWEFTFDIMIDEQDKHYGYPLNAGFRHLVFDQDFNKVQATITAKDGSEPTEPVPLDLSGEQIEEPAPESVIYRETKKYPMASYYDLPGIE